VAALGRLPDLNQWEVDWASRPRLRGWLHATALPLALAATAGLTARRRTHRMAVAAYGVGLSAMLATSAGYHRLTRTERQFRWSQPADHMMIFAAIAGSATPVAAAVLPAPVIRPAIASLWAGAALGAFGRMWDLRRGTSISSFAYIALGWSGAALLPLVIRRHGMRNGMLMAAGGLSYSVGAGLFAMQRPNPWPAVFGYHEVWHTATLVGAACHLAAIADITRDGVDAGGQIDDPDGPRIVADPSAPSGPSGTTVIPAVPAGVPAGVDVSVTRDQAVAAVTSTASSPPVTTTPGPNTEVTHDPTPV
jgi:hemolysin III